MENVENLSQKYYPNIFVWTLWFHHLLISVYFYTINFSSLKRNQVRHCRYVANLRERKHVRIENLYLQIQVKFPGTRKYKFSTIPPSTKNFFPQLAWCLRGFERNRKPEKLAKQKEKKKGERDENRIGCRTGTKIFSWNRSRFPRSFGSSTIACT